MGQALETHVSDVPRRPFTAPSTDSAKRAAFEEYEMGDGSAHPGGRVNFVMGDGSVINVTEKIDPNVFSAMG